MNREAIAAIGIVIGTVSIIVGCYRLIMGKYLDGRSIKDAQKDATYYYQARYDHLNQEIYFKLPKDVEIDIPKLTETPHFSVEGHILKKYVYYLPETDDIIVSQYSPSKIGRKTRRKYLGEL